MINNDYAPLRVTGESKLYFIVGDPIAQVRSTHLYNKMAAEKNVDAVFVPFQFAASNFNSFVASLREVKNLSGIIPTIPHKAKMLTCVDRCTERSTQVGAVNSIRIEPDGSWGGLCKWFTR